MPCPLGNGSPAVTFSDDRVRLLVVHALLPPRPSGRLEIFRQPNSPRGLQPAEGRSEPQRLEGRAGNRACGVCA